MNGTDTSQPGRHRFQKNPRDQCLGEHVPKPMLFDIFPTHFPPLLPSNEVLPRRSIPSPLRSSPPSI